MRAPSGPGDGAIQAVDLARTLAILPVLALHATARLLPPGQALPGLWDHLQRNGAYGVSLFFMISGFLITRTLDRGRDGAFQARWGAFYARRAGRILPLLALDLLLGLALWRCFQNDPLGFGYSLNLPLNAADPGFWLPLLFFAFNWARALWALNDWGSIGVHWAVLWSLAVEEQFYLVYPLVLRALGRVRNLVLFLVFLLAAGFGWRWFVYLQPLNNGLDWKWGSFGYFDQLGLGIGLYFAQKEWGGRLAGRPWAAWAFFILGAFGFGAVYWSTSCGRLLDLFYAPFLSTAWAALGLLGALNLPFFESRVFRPFALPGKYSYGNYLFHGSVLFFAAPLLSGWGVYPAFLAFAAASTALAALSFHFFEVPANRWVRERLGAR